MFGGGEIWVFAATFSIVAVFIFLRRFKQRGVKDDGKRYPPSLPVLPVFSAILHGGIGELPEHFMRSAEKLGPIFTLKVGRRVVLVINGFEAIYDALVRHADAFSSKDSVWIEKNVTNREQRGIVFAQYDDVYKKYHKLSLSILKEFGFGIERVMETRILEEVESLNEELLKLNGRPFDPKWPVTYAASNVVLSILFGKNFLKSHPKDISTIVENSSGYFSNMDLSIEVASLFRFLPIFRRKIDCMRNFNQNMLNSIETGIKLIKSNNSDPSFVGRFLDIEGADYNHQDLLYVVRDLCLGGTETVPITLEWSLVELANHSEIQNRFQNEIDEVVPVDRLPSLDDKSRLPYTEAVILEIMRRHVIGPFYIRHTSVKETKVLHYNIPKGCQVMMNAYSAHMETTFWKDPENFRPDRFLDRDNKIINSARLVQFGLGKRSCIGEILARQSAFLFLTSLVQRFDIRPPEGQDSITVTDVTSFSTTPSQFEVRLIPRVNRPTQD